MRRRASIWRGALALACLLTHAAAAQPEGDPDRLTVELRVGFEGDSSVAGERHVPAVFTVQSGAEPRSGFLQIRYQQDATQRVVQRLPFATTPGRAVTVETAIALRPNSAQLSVEARDDRFRLLFRDRFDPEYAGAATVFPPVLLEDARRVLDVSADVAAAMAQGAFLSSPDRDADELAAGRSVVVLGSAPESLPLIPAAYESLTAVVADARTLARADRRRLAALHEWVESGGRLLLLADAAGPEWRAALPASAAAAVTLDDPRAWTLDPSTEGTGTEETGERDPGESDRPSPPRETFGRAVGLTEHGERHGWALSLPARGQTPAAGERAPGFLAASGPAGFGFVEVWGVTPRALGDAPAERWPIFAARLGVDGDASEGEQPWTPYYGLSASGASAEERAALAAAVDHVLVAPEIGDGVFYVIAAGLGLLAVLVGPVDGLVLKRLGARHLSWATALGWTLLACAIALVGPGLVRRDRNGVGRLAVIDAIVPNGEIRLGAAHAQRAGVLAVFAAGGGAVPWAEAPPGVWTRGFSPLVTWEDQPRTTQRPLGLFISPRPGAGGPLPVAWPLSPMDTTQSVWTARTTMDASRVPESGLPAVFLSRTAEGLRLRAGGLLPGGEVRSVVIETADGAYAMPQGAARAASGTLDVLVPPREGDAAVEDLDPRRWTQRARRRDPADWLDMPGPRRRGAAIAQRVRAGGWAEVRIEVERAGAITPGVLDEANPAARLRVGIDADERRVELLRLLVPLAADGSGG